MQYNIWTTITCWMKPRLYEGTCAMRSYQCAHVTFIFSACHAAPNHEKPYAAINFFTSSKESPCSPETRFQQLIAAQLTRHAQVCPTASLTSSMKPPRESIDADTLLCSLAKMRPKSRNLLNSLLTGTLQCQLSFFALSYQYVLICNESF